MSTLKTINIYHSSSANANIVLLSNTDVVMSGNLTVSRSATVAGNVSPSSSNTYDLGSSTARWRNIYTGDLHLSNRSNEDGNIVDGTTGDWTIQEGAENLYIINNKSGKKYKFSLQEIV